MNTPTKITLNQQQISDVKNILDKLKADSITLEETTNGIGLCHKLIIQSNNSEISIDITDVSKW